MKLKKQEEARDQQVASRAGDVKRVANEMRSLMEGNWSEDTVRYAIEGLANRLDMVAWKLEHEGTQICRRVK